MRAIKPLSELGGRVPEAGRIRMGKRTTSKSGKQIPTSIDTWRFTSPHRESIEAIAGLYGGSARPWNEKSARIQNQYEVITETNTIRVLLPPGGLSCWYETWAAGLCTRRCDGQRVEVPSTDPNEATETLDCLCAQENEMTCKPYSRLSVVLPEIAFRGVWRLDTKSWNAADELPAMEELIQELQAGGEKIIEARLVLEKRSSVASEVDGKKLKRHFVVPRIDLDYSAEALASGAGGIAALGVSPETPALEQGEVELVDDVPLDDEVIEAEIVGEEDVGDRDAISPTPPSERAHVKLILEVRLIHQHPNVAEDITEEQLRHGICFGVSEHRTSSSKDLTSAEIDQALDFCADIAAGRVEVTNYDSENGLTIKRHKK